MRKLSRINAANLRRHLYGPEWPARTLKSLPETQRPIPIFAILLLVVTVAFVLSRCAMDESKIKGDVSDILKRLAEPFFDQGTTPVYAATCCGRLFVGEVAPVKCRVCGGRPEAQAFASLSEVEAAKIPAPRPPA